MTSRPFSAREGFRGQEPLVYDDAPDGVRYGIREVLAVLSYRTPTAQRRILCGALRVPPDPYNWSDYPNVDSEVAGLTSINPWFKFLDGLERIPRFLPSELVPTYFEKMNELFADESLGYRFDSGSLVRIGTEAFHLAVETARHALQDEKFTEPRRQFERAYEFRNSFPPDWANAIKEAVNSVEAVLQIIFDSPGVALPTIVSQNLPAELPGGIRRMFSSLYSHGSGTVGARHAAIGGNQPTGPRAELAIHVAAALHTFAVAELEN